MNLLFMILYILPATFHTIMKADLRYILIWVNGWLKSIWVWFIPQEGAEWHVVHNKAIGRYISYGGKITASDYSIPFVWRFTNAFSFGVNYMRFMTWEARSKKPVHHK